jgi:hypothetical protein
LFPRLEKELEDNDFSLNNELHATMMTTLWNISVGFHQAFNKWIEH